MREIKYIVLHCTATAPHTSVESIKNFWKTKLGWSRPGYHHLVDNFGKVTLLESSDNICNGVKGYNEHAIHIAYIGGINVNGKASDTRTDLCKRQMFRLVRHYTAMFPQAKVLGHRDFPKVNKACPCFDALTWYIESLVETIKPKF